MSTYSLSKKIPSCEFDKKIAKEIEAYIRSKIPTENSKEYGNSYVVKIIDPTGSESMNSVELITQDTFPNDIESIEFSGNTTGDANIKIYLKLGKNEHGSELRVTVSSINAKEIARGIASEIERLLYECKTANWLFYGLYGALPFVLFGIAIGILFSSSRNDAAAISPILSFLALITLVAIWNILKRLAPYTEFDTRRNRTKNTWVRWFLNGLLGVAVFSGISKIIWGT
ncbi:hypothetical protein [Pseudomonas peli]|uniref:hypothetical protein n=1 Tax=Pseudomonas peli TaxID=592361 RepID=UPI00285FF807|nr:hypothetical protein [Pseudomonas peli]MDR7024610.1 hypothetical protein [Pseudomonas peli]